MVPPSRKSCYNFRVVEINRVVDGDTIDVTIDLGFDLYKKERVRVAGVDTPEKRTRDLEEKALGYEQPTEPKKNWRVQYLVMMSCLLGLNLLVGLGNMGVFWVGYTLGAADVSLNEQMIDEGYAWAYDGGTKQKNFEELREILAGHMAHLFSFLFAVTLWVQVPQWSDDWSHCAVDVPDSSCHWYIVNADNTFGEGFDWANASWFDVNGLQDIANLHDDIIDSGYQYTVEALNNAKSF